jgi:hypothetical protein
VAGWNDTEYDPQGRIIGWGLTLRPTPTSDAARDWQNKHPGMELLGVIDAHRVSRPLSEMLLNEHAPPL